jgi:hypothetical protein
MSPRRSSGVERFNMEHEKEVGLAGNSGRGAGMKVRTLYLLPTRSPVHLAVEAVTTVEEPWIEADPVGWDAPISVWWDQPPGGDAL